MKNIDIAGLFPTPVWTRTLAAEKSQPLNDQLRCLVTRLQGNADEETGPQWQSQQRLHRLPKCAALCDEIVAFAAELCDDMTIVGSEAIAISACWANLLSKGGSIRSHFHPNNYLSGSYYVSVSPGSNAIRFYDPRPQCNLIVPPAADPSRTNPSQLSLSVNTGSLVLFPAWLAHSVDPNQSDQTRISIAFNLMFPDFGKSMAGPVG